MAETKTVMLRTRQIKNGMLSFTSVHENPLTFT